MRPQEQLLIDSWERLALSPGARVLCNSVGRGQFAATVARRDASARVTCCFLDLYQQQQASAAHRDLPNLRFLCQADPPREEVDLAAFALSKQGDAELCREVLQAGFDLLAVGGALVATTDNPADAWLHQRMRELLKKVTRQPTASGVLYRGTKTEPLRKVKNYACEFPFRDGERLLELRTRPGVFSHRSLDGGARALIAAMEIPPGLRVLDLGCGSGAVGLAAAARDAATEVVALDSNPRAVESAQWGAQRNALPNLTARLDCDGSTLAAESFDLVLANPPYYSNFRLAELFVEIAHRALRPGGELLVVTKRADWYLDHLPPRFTDLAATAGKNYCVLKASKRSH